jgi:protein-S-isoprenylcysteine O-methyltransferase Ste14
MIRPDAGTIVRWAWLVFGAWWLLAALRVNRTKRREPAGDTLVRIITGGTAFVLMFYSDPQFPTLNGRFVPDAAWIRGLGAALTSLGIAFAIWARVHIGRYWSSSVSLRTGHELVRTGPYSRIRHPIYTGILLALAGTALFIGRYRTLLAFVIMLVGFAWKASREEALLAGEFGPLFDEHKRLTGFFFPRLW